MKKSFTLKAFAFGVATTVALSASATPHQFLVDNTKTASAISTSDFSKAPKRLTDRMEIQKMTVKLTPATQQTTAKKAPAKKADANYGEWAEGGDGVYTYACLSSAEANVEYEIRQDNANEGNFQLKTYYGKGVYTSYGSEAIITVTANEDGTYTATLPTSGIGLGISGRVDANTTCPLYVYDLYGYYQNLQSKGFTFSDGSSISDEDLENVKSYCTYDPETGTAEFLCVTTSSFDDPTTVDGEYVWNYYWGTYGADESYRRIGSEFKNYNIDLDSAAAYFSHAKGATTGTYNLDTELNDCSWIAFRMVNSKLSTTTTALSNAVNTLYNELAAGTVADDVCYMTESGLAQIPVTSYRKGNYTLIYLYAAGETAYYGYGYLSATKDDVDFYDAGMASFTDAVMYDALIPVFLGSPATYDYSDLQDAFASDYGVELPDEYTVSVPCQANSKNEGEYRLVHPYAQYYNEYMSNVLDYDPTCDYLTFNISDPAESYIEPTATGIYFYTSSGDYIMIAYGSTNQMDGGAAASEDAWGTFADGVLSFDEVTIPSGATSEDECTGALSYTQATYDEESGEYTLPDWSTLIWSPEVMKIETSIAGIKNVIADTNDANAPVEYFNLQGMRVANPAAGQLLIQRQGSKATKVVIR
jgi:hypothetical protein